jgi:hypothetical protein
MMMMMMMMMCMSVVEVVESKVRLLNVKWWGKNKIIKIHHRE